MRFKIFIIVSVFLSLFLFCPAKADVYGLSDAQKATGGSLPPTVGGASNLPELAGVIVNVALSLIGILFFILMLYAGITWMKAMGSTEDITKAKEMIIQAIIGLVIVMSAYAISNLVFTSLGASGGGGGNSPSGSQPVLAEKAPCSITNENWSDGTVKLTGTSGVWNTNGSECQPSCRYYNKVGICQLAACAVGHNISDKVPPNSATALAGSTCPVGNCCLK